MSSLVEEIAGIPTQFVIDVCSHVLGKGECHFVRHESQNANMEFGGEIIRAVYSFYVPRELHALSGEFFELAGDNWYCRMHYTTTWLLAPYKGRVRFATREFCITRVDLHNEPKFVQAMTYAKMVLSE